MAKAERITFKEFRTRFATEEDCRNYMFAQNRIPLLSVMVSKAIQDCRTSLSIPQSMKSEISNGFTLPLATSKHSFLAPIMEAVATISPIWMNSASAITDASNQRSSSLGFQGLLLYLVPC